MDEATFKRRTRELGLAAIRLTDELGRDAASGVIGRQLIRCATSVGANYRSACRSRSTADLLSRLAIVEEEADEVCYWLEMLADAGRVPQAKVEPLVREAEEIVRMTVASIRTLKNRAPARIQNRESKIQNGASR